jgi:ubiquinone/menaquinone biosynthesis C-methylase UbiE
MTNTDQRTAIATTFNSVAARYDTNRFFGLSADKLVSYIPTTATSILDVSTGTGKVALALAKRMPHASIDAVDISEGMLEQARINTQDYNTIHFIHADVDTLDYPAHHFDAITCGYGLFFYPDMEASFSRLWQFLRPGGVFAFSSFTTNAFTPAADLFLAMLEDDWHIAPPGLSRARLDTARQIEELIASVTPKDWSVEYYPIRYPITPEDWWQLLTSAGYKGLLDQLEPQQRSVFKRRHLAQLDILAHQGALTLNADSLFGIAMK